MRLHIHFRDRAPAAPPREANGPRSIQTRKCSRRKGTKRYRKGKIRHPENQERLNPGKFECFSQTCVLRALICGKVYTSNETIRNLTKKSETNQTCKENKRNYPETGTKIGFAKVVVGSPMQADTLSAFSKDPFQFVSFALSSNFNKHLAPASKVPHRVFLRYAIQASAGAQAHHRGLSWGGVWWLDGVGNVTLSTFKQSHGLGRGARLCRSPSRRDLQRSEIPMNAATPRTSHTPGLNFHSKPVR